VTVLKRATLSVIRNMFQSLLLLLVFFALMLFVLTVLSLRQGVRLTEVNMWQQVPRVVHIRQDEAEMTIHEQQYGYFPDWPHITTDLLLDIAALPYVEHMELFLEQDLFAPNIQRYFSSDFDDARDLFSIYYHFPYFHLPEGQQPLTGEQLGIERIRTRGVSLENFFELNLGIFELAHGRSFTEEEIASGAPVVIISEQFARLNGLDIGSTLSIKDFLTRGVHDGTMNWFTEKNVIDSLEVELEIIGIFEMMNFQRTSFSVEEAHLMTANTLFIPYELSLSIYHWFWQTWYDHDAGMRSQIRYWQEHVPSEHFFLLYDARDLRRFHQAAARHLPAFLTTVDGSRQLRDVQLAFESIETMTFFFFAFLILASFVVVGLLLLLILQEKKHQVGIYLALGEKRKNILMENLIQILLLVHFSFALVLIFLPIITDEITQRILIPEFISSQEALDLRYPPDILLGGNFALIDNIILGLPNTLVHIEPERLTLDGFLSLVNLSFGYADFILFYVVTIGMTLVALIIPFITFMKWNPKKLLIHAKDGRH